MKRNLFTFAIAAVLMLMSTSCVTKKQYVGLQNNYDSLRTRYGTLRGDYNSLQSDYNDAKVALAEARTQNKSLEERLADAHLPFILLVALGHHDAIATGRCLFLDACQY